MANFERDEAGLRTFLQAAQRDKQPGAALTIDQDGRMVSITFTLGDWRLRDTGFHNGTKSKGIQIASKDNAPLWQSKYNVETYAGPEMGKIALITLGELTERFPHPELPFIPENGAQHEGYQATHISTNGEPTLGAFSIRQSLTYMITDELAYMSTIDGGWVD